MRESSKGRTRANGSIVDLPAGERHRLLAADRRRLVLQVLAGEAPPVDLEGLAAAVAAREAADDAVEEQTVERVTITLHHNHLPTLAAAGALEYDPESNRIDPEG